MKPGYLIEYNMRNNQKNISVSSMLLVLPVWLRIFRQLGFSAYMVLLELQQSIYQSFFDRVWYAGFLLKIKFYKTSGQASSLISSFLINRLLYLVVDSKTLVRPR